MERFFMVYPCFRDHWRGRGRAVPARRHPDEGVPPQQRALAPGHPAPSGWLTPGGAALHEARRPAPLHPLRQQGESTSTETSRCSPELFVVISLQHCAASAMSNTTNVWNYQYYCCYLFSTATHSKHSSLTGFLGNIVFFYQSSWLNKVDQQCWQRTCWGCIWMWIIFLNI